MLECVEHVAPLLELVIAIFVGLPPLESVKFLVFIIYHGVVDVLEHHFTGAHLVGATAVIAAEVLLWRLYVLLDGVIGLAG